MKTKAGLWIDQKKAVVVLISDKGEEVKVVKSNIDKFFQHAGGEAGKNDFGRKDFPAYDIVKRDMAMHAQKFYGDIISLIRNADRVYIFGPGQAKTGLVKCIKANKFMTHNVKSESADKLTTSGILKKVRGHFRVEVTTGVGSAGYLQPVGG